MIQIVKTRVRRDLEDLDELMEAASTRQLKELCRKMALCIFQIQQYDGDDPLMPYRYVDQFDCHYADQIWKIRNGE